MSDAASSSPRLRQAVLAASDLDSVTATVREELDLGEPFSDPAVAVFGLENRVFALGDTFLEVVSPVTEETTAGRWLGRRGGDSGYMLMFEVDDLESPRRRAAAQGIREVFQVELEDMAEVHLHPRDMNGTIVALSVPKPPGSWRWGGPGWDQRSRPLQVNGATIGTRDPEYVSKLWSGVLGGPADAAGIQFAHDETESGLTEISIAGYSGHDPLVIGSVRLNFTGTDGG